MPKCTLSLFLLILFSLSFGQTLLDKQKVIQLSIDLERLQPYLLNQRTTRTNPLVIFDDEVISDSLKLIKFNKPVLFMSKEDIFFNNRKDFLDFELFNINKSKAEVVFKYPVEGLLIKSRFEKIDEKWVLINSKIIEQ